MSEILTNIVREMRGVDEHERLSSGIEKFHVEKPEVDKIEVYKITPTGEVTWVREPTTTCPPVLKGAENKETIQNIIAEMRQCADQLHPRAKYIPTLSIRAWRRLCDRIEEAAKREMAKGMSKKLDENRVISNAAALREAENDGDDARCDLKCEYCAKLDCPTAQLRRLEKQEADEAKGGAE